MGVLADLKHRTGVGVGGVFLYVVVVAAGVAIASLRGTVDEFRGNPFVFVSGLVYALGLLGVVSAVCNAPRTLWLAVARRRGLRVGRTAATGTVQTTSGTVPSPFQDDPVVCYTYRVLENDEDDAPDPDEEKNWTLVERGSDGVDFALVTDSGERLCVESAGAAKRVSDRDEIAVGIDEEPPDSVRTFCREADIPAADADTARRYQEATLAPGDEAFVSGRAVDEAGLTIRDGSPFVVADSDYPTRVRSRVTLGLVLGVPVTAVGFVALLLAAGAL